MHVLVTRPQPQAAQWVEQLRRRGVDADALPLIAIEPADPAPVRAEWDALAANGLVVFVSPNAVAQFFALRPAGAAWPDVLRAATPGPGSAKALRAEGVARVVEPAADAATFDSESLWRELDGDEWRGVRVLVVRGDGGRDWLAERLRERGADVSFVQAYRRGVPQLDAAQRALLADAQAQPSQHLWHFSSSQAIDHLQRLAPHADWSRAGALASHPRIAARARGAGFGRVDDIAATLEALCLALQHRPLQSGRP